MSKRQHNFINTCNSLTVESVLEQGSSKIMEDYLVHENGVFAVLDGATSLNGQVFKNKTGGQLAAGIGAKHLGSGRGALSLRIQKANNEIRKSMATSGRELTGGEGRWSASLAALRVHTSHIEWSQLGDCRILFLYQDGGHALAHQPENHDSETLNLMAELGERDVAMADQRMQDQLIKVRRNANRCYGVLNGDPRATSFLKSGFHSRQNVSDVLIFTDGLLFPGEEEQAMSQMAQLYRKGGLSLVHSTLRDLQKADPRCLQFPRFKMCDDISAISLSL